MKRVPIRQIQASPGLKEHAYVFRSCSVLILGVRDIFCFRSVLVREKQQNFCSCSVLVLEQEHVREQFLEQIDTIFFGITVKVSSKNIL